MEFFTVEISMNRKQQNNRNQFNLADSSDAYFWIANLKNNFERLVCNENSSDHVDASKELLIQTRVTEKRIHIKVNELILLYL